MTQPSQRLTWNEFIKTKSLNQPLLIVVNNHPGMYIIKDYYKLGQKDYLVCLVIEPDPETGKTKIIGGSWINADHISSMTMFEDTGAEVKEKQKQIISTDNITIEQAKREAEQMKNIGGKI